jgi:carbamoyl-phosphate synthase small subunit
VKKAQLVLEDGRAFAARSFGADGEAVAEIVFNTSMTGYQEILTDPSYAGQLVVMTVSHVGNYGVNEEDVESAKPQAVGFALRDCCPAPSSWRSKGDLAGYLRQNGLLGIDDLDTRALTRHLRTRGAMMGIVSTTDLDEKRLHEKLKGVPGMAGRDLVPAVSCKEPYDWSTEGDVPIVVVDCGIKRSTLRYLAKLGGRVTVVPATASAAEILERKPRGVLVSNGPGDPAAVTYTIETIRGLLGKVPLFGICLGHQLLALALGGKTYKLKFGHRGGNQPVKDLRTDKVHVSAHNHGFSVDLASLPKADVEPWFVNLNDGTNEGLRHKQIQAASVQFHPEAAPGPNDCRYIFTDWLACLRSPS